eukprot:TRINITY_DN7170_c0_g1_i1.p2 TRINITY_DN7170_c0_g1~~TRINITY_DN7170_c0_g1_i1.p2  ORF type:complete len:58 (-),score=5.37 TRINITY_DN7170_c0_g1_i1:149-322(-)
MCKTIWGCCNVSLELVWLSIAIFIKYAGTHAMKNASVRNNYSNMSTQYDNDEISQKT